MVKRNLFLQYKGLALPTILLTAVALCLCQSTYLGSFAYPFHFIFGIFSFFIWAITFTHTFTSKAHKPLHMFGRSFLSFIPPLCVVLIYRPTLGSCDLNTGLKWFLLLPCISLCFAFASSLFALAFEKSKLKTYLLTFLPTLIFSCINLSDYLFSPQISFFNPAFGYFSGPIYDEWIPIDFAVISFRCWVVLLSLTLALPFLAKKALEKTFFRFLFFIVFSFTLSFMFMRSPLHWRSSFSFIEKQLSVHHESEHAKLFTSPQVYSEAEIKVLMDILDHTILYIHKQLKLAPGKKVSLYVYDNPHQKKELTGSSETLIGNPIHKAIHTLPLDVYSSILRHELVHVSARSLGLMGLTLPFPWVEGLAESVAYERSGFSMHEWAKAYLEKKTLPDPASLLNLRGFFSSAGPRSYSTLGSFSRFLIDTYGIEKFKAVYQGKKFQTIYGRSISALTQEWKNMLQSVPLSQEHLNFLEPTLKQQSVTQKRCPHDEAEKTHQSCNHTPQALQKPTPALEGQTPLPELFNQVAIAYGQKKFGLAYALLGKAAHLEQQEEKIQRRYWMYYFKLNEMLGDAFQATLGLTKLHQLHPTAGSKFFAEFHISRLLKKNPTLPKQLTDASIPTPCLASSPAPVPGTPPPPNHPRQTTQTSVLKE